MPLALAMAGRMGRRVEFEGWLCLGFSVRMVSLSGGAVSGGVGRLSGLSVCEDVCTLASAVGAVGLSGCRRFRVLSGGVGLSGLCRGEQPYFVVSGLHQGLTQTTTNKELRNRTQHAYLEIYAPQNFFKPKVCSSTLAF